MLPRPICLRLGLFFISANAENCKGFKSNPELSSRISHLSLPSPDWRHLNFCALQGLRVEYFCRLGGVKLFSFLSRLCRKSHRGEEERVTRDISFFFSLSSDPHLMRKHANPKRSPPSPPCHPAEISRSAVRQFAIVIIIFSVTWQLRVVQKKKNDTIRKTRVRPDLTQAHRFALMICAVVVYDVQHFSNLLS